MSYQSEKTITTNVVDGTERTHTLAGERVDDLFLDTLLTLGQSFILPR